MPSLEMLSQVCFSAAEIILELSRAHTAALLLNWQTEIQRCALLTTCLKLRKGRETGMSQMQGSIALDMVRKH